MRKELYERMYKTFPKFQLADYNWKVEHVTTDVFAQLTANKRKAMKKNSKPTQSKKGKKWVHSELIFTCQSISI